MTHSGTWTFKGDIAARFDQHVRSSIPAYDWMQESVVRLTDFFCPSFGSIVDIGCATGETLSRISERHAGKSCRYIGIDESAEMIAEAKKKLKEIEHCHWQTERIQDVLLPQNVDMVLSVLTVQFLPIADRERLVSRIYKALRPGGAFLLVEKVYAESGRMQDMFSQIYHDQKEQAGFTAQEIREKDASLRGVMTPLTVAQNEAMLKRAGFEQLEVFVKDFHFAGWIAVKPTMGGEKDGQERE